MDESRTWFNHFEWPSWLVMLSSLTIIIVIDIEILCPPSKDNQRHCVDTEKFLCTQGNSVSTQEYSRYVSHSKVIRRHHVDTGKLLCTQENYCVLTQKVRVHLFKLILCQPLNSKWETLC